MLPTHGLVHIVIWVLSQNDNLDVIKGTCVEGPAHPMQIYNELTWEQLLWSPNCPSTRLSLQKGAIAVRVQ